MFQTLIPANSKAMEPSEDAPLNHDTITSNQSAYLPVDCFQTGVFGAFHNFPSLLLTPSQLLIPHLQIRHDESYQYLIWFC